MSTAAHPWQYAVMAVVLALSIAGVLFHLFPRLRERTRAALGELLARESMPAILRRAAERLDARPRGGCAGCDSRGAAPRAISTISLPASRRRKP
ncbi:DUF6587 family protein [Achromobacter aloeverae]